MRPRSAHMIASFVSFTLLAAFAPAQADAQAVVLLRKDCTGLGDCFETMTELSDPDTGWIWNTRVPDASSPLLVDIGPGEFERFDCPDGNGHVTLRGAGREQTILKDTIGAQIVNCTRLAFIDLGIHGSRYAVFWQEQGDATWTNVDLFSLPPHTLFNIGWAEACTPVIPPAAPKSLQYLFGSRVWAIGRGQALNAAWFGDCSEAWFFGGELLVDVNEATPSIATHGVHLINRADFRAFGTVIRTLVSEYAPSEVVGVSLQSPDAIFHIHGGIINTSVTADIGTNPPIDATGLQSQGFAHTPGTAFVVKASAGGTPTRLKTLSGGTIQSPFLWQPGTQPPAAASETNELVSLPGQDVFVETDCASDGDCDAGGSQTHMMVYNDVECAPADPWFDLVTGRCRGDTGP